MLSLFRRATAITGLVALARGPMGQKVLAAAQRQLSDPRNQQRIAALRSRLARSPR